MGNAGKRVKGRACGDSRLRFGCSHRVFLRLEVGGDALGARFLSVRCSVNRTTMFWPNGDISIT